MKISQKSWKSYIDKLSKIDKTATEKVAEYYRANPDISMNELIYYAYNVSSYYGEAAGELSCEMYDEVATTAKRVIPPAEPARTATYGEIAGAVASVLSYTKNADVIGAEVGKSVKKVSLETIKNNALRDGAEFAWVPSGDTCAFCIMLASNGWRRASKKAIRGGHKEHVHSNCDCTYAVRFDQNTEVEGYDPEYYLDIYDNAEGYSWQDKVNSIRRDYYARNKDAINIQKRAAYAERNIHAIKRNTNTTWNGKPHNNSKTDIESLKQTALDKGIILDPSFTSFDGDIGLVNDFIEKIRESIAGKAFIRSKDIRLKVSYTMNDDVYSETNKSTITINGFAYRDRGILEKDYEVKRKERWFTKESSYMDIPTHEAGHALVYLNQLKVKGVRNSVYGHDRLISSDLIMDSISEYALKNEHELIAEAFVCYKNGVADENILKVLEYCGMI